MNKVFIKLDKGAELPTKANGSYDRGYDVKAVDLKIDVRNGNVNLIYDTGIALQPALQQDSDYGLQANPTFINLVPRSSIYKKDLLLCNSVGIGDVGYTGNYSFVFALKGYNKPYTLHSLFGLNKLECGITTFVTTVNNEEVIIITHHYSFKIFDTKIRLFTTKQQFQIYNIGDRIGQILFNQGEDVEFIEVDNLESYDTRGEGGFGSSDLK